MIDRIIEFSVRHRLFVFLLSLAVTGTGVWATSRIRLDAIPDLSDVQVIVVTEFPGQNPEVVDQQITYPLSSALLAVPGATDVRGVSMFELSFVYVLFDDDTDLYWARSRVLETLNVARDRLPDTVSPKIGPDATGVGWVYQYALIEGHYCALHPNGLFRDEANDRWYAAATDAPEDRRAHLEHTRVFESAGTCPLDGSPLQPSGQDLADLRSLQDWYLRFPLNAVEGVAEVASIGGFVRQYQVVLDPLRMQAFGVSVADAVEAIQRSNQDVGGAVIERSEHEYMVRSRAYLRGLDDLAAVALGSDSKGAPILLRDVAHLQVGGEARRGIGELDGRGEAVGGIIIARFGENAYKVIGDTKRRLRELEEGLPPGVAIRSTYDRSALIRRAVDTLRDAVIEELLVVAAVCVVFLGHLRSAAVAVLVLPIGLLVSLLVMQGAGINANIMSLGGLALAIGVMVDSAVVMVENAHQHLLRSDAHDERTRVEAILGAAREVGPSLFYSLLVITVSFLPIFVLGDQSGRLFKPLAYTKTFAIAAGSILGITLVPALMASLIRGRIPSEESNPVNRLSMAIYEPAFRFVLRHPIVTLGTALLLGLSTIYPLSRIGEEFMPALDEGDLLYMPTTDPSIGVGKSAELLQQTDKLIASFPEVASVHGKIGRANTATDPAPMSMIETVIQLHPDPSAWRSRTIGYGFSDWPDWLKWPLTSTFWPEQRTITIDELKFGWSDADGTKHPGLNEVVALPGVANAWPYPIENRINMLSTGIKTPVGIKLLGQNLDVLGDLAERTAAEIQKVPGAVSAYPERTLGGYYLDIEVDRNAVGRFGATTGDVQDVIATAIGGLPVTMTVEGVARYPVSVRFAREWRDDIDALHELLIPLPDGRGIPLGQLARIRVTPGPPMIRSENAERSAWVFVDIGDRDLGGFVRDAKRAVEDAVPLPPGYSRLWSGRFEYLERANERLAIVVPLTFVLIVLLLFAANRSWFRVAIILLAVPFSLIGAVWLQWFLGYNLSLATWVGMIALLGVDAETGQVMLLYLDSSYDRFRDEGRLRSREDLIAAIHDGAVKRIRPKAMTVATDMLGLLPLMWAAGSGADVTRRLVAPLIGGITVSFLMELLVYPVIYYLARRRELPTGE